MAGGRVAGRPEAGSGLSAGFGPGWAAATAESLPGAALREVRRLGGGTTAETFVLDTSGGEIVVKRYRRRRNDAARYEWERLRFAQRVGVPVPRPLALDAEGRWFGRPAFAMTRIPGRLNVDPTDVESWLRQLAQALAAIHVTDTAGAVGPLLRPPPIKTRRPPELHRPTPLVDRTVAAIKDGLSRLTWPPVLTHGDFHPGNTLWRRDQLTGIADWTESRLGPAASDLAYCRTDVALLFGRAAAERLTHHYAASIGTVPADLPVFDLVWGLDAYRKRTRILRAHRAQGRAASPRQYSARVTALLRYALAELGPS